LTGSHAADPASASRLSALFASAEERVADALMLAELLAPMLAQQLSPALAALGPAPAAAAHSSASTAHKSPAPPPRPGASGTVPGIADFIEEMLARERPAR